MKDHKGNQDGKRGPKRKLGFFPLLLLFLSGVAAGMGGAALIAFQINQVPLPFIAPPTRDASERNFLEPEEPEDESLQFHQILQQRTPPGQEAEADGEPPSEAGPEAAVRAPAPPSAHFVLVGSFAERERADAMLGELALINLRAAVRDSRTSGGQRYRVLVGPYPTAVEAEEVRAQLAFNGYNSSLVTASSQ